MLKRLAAIAFIYFCTTGAWIILGTTILLRTNSSEASTRGKVESVWGAPQTQDAPTATYYVANPVRETVEENGTKKTVERVESKMRPLAPSRSDVQVGLELEHRKKGMLWYATYKVAFQGEYEFQNPDAVDHAARLTLKLPAAQATYDDLQFTVNGKPAPLSTGSGGAFVTTVLPAGSAVTMHVAYRSQGLDSWRYSFGSNVTNVENFRLRMTTNFRNIDFPENTLSPGAKRETPEGWELDWDYKNLLSGYQIAMAMPQKLQPGPITSEISFFAPVSLFFFFFVLLIITTIRNIDLHPMNYFFLAAAFFAFHLLMAYLVDHIDINASFLISAIVSVLLVVTYLRIVTGTRFALREAAIAQFIYLVLFSFAFFFKGYTGLAVTIGSVVTLFVAMQMTGRIKWSEKFRAVGPPPLPSAGR